jgi:hypothetical protein
VDSVGKKGFKDYLYSVLPYLLTAALGFCVGAYVTGWHAGDNDNAGRIDELTADIQRIEQQQSAIAETLQRAVGAIERAEQHSAGIAEGIGELKSRIGSVQAGATEGVGAAEKDGKLIEQGQRIIAEVQRRNEEAAAAAKS